MEPTEILGPPQLPYTEDNWKLTPLTEKQFSFMYDVLARERAEKAMRIDDAVKGIPALEAAVPKDVQPHEIPILTWASPKEFERVIEFAHRMREERNEARLAFGVVRAIASKQGMSKEGIDQAIKDVLALGKQIDRNLIDTPAIRGYRAASGFVGKVPMELPGKKY